MSTLTNNQVFANRYLLKKLIGVGGYSQVWLAEDIKAGNMEVAIKIYAPEKGLDSDGIETFGKEFTLVFNLNHAHLLRPMHYDVSEDSPYLVMQYCPKGSLFKRIGETTEQELAHFMQQAASALNYLHNQDPPIIHQDIKPDNFLIDSHGNYLLADFGISSKIRRTLTKSMGTQASTGTLAYMPPEKFSADKQIIKAGDIFSLGVTMYELLTGDLPFGDNGGLTLKAGAEVPNLPGNFSPDLNRLLIRCMAKEPWERPTAEQLEDFATKFLQTSHWPVFGNAAQKPTPETTIKIEQPHVGRKTEPIPQQKPEHQTEPAKKRNLAPWIITAVVVVIGIVVAIIWPKGPTANELNEKAIADSIHISDSMAAVQAEHQSMVFVQGGTFKMGNPDGKSYPPLHSITLNDFYIGKYEVTQMQWRNVMGNNPSSFSGCDDCPVEQISWDDVQEFIQKLNQQTGKSYRLPTEAEWEYAAKGGNKSSGYVFSGSNSVGDVAWDKDNSDSKTHPVGQKLPNELGLFDMTGNVFEWCSDWFRYDYYIISPRNNPIGPSSSYRPDKGDIGRVIRGGGWEDDIKDCWVWERGFNHSDLKANYTGFRLVLVP